MLEGIRRNQGLFKRIHKIVVKMAFAGEAATNYRLGKEYKHSDMVAAMKCFRKAIKIEPHYADAHYELGDVYHELGRLLPSIDAFKTAADLYPKLINAHINIGIAYSNRGKFDEAIREFGKAMRAHSNCADAHSKLGIEYIIDSNPFESKLHYEMALKVKADVAIVHLHLSAVHEKRGKFDDAISELKKAMKINPKYDNPIEAHTMLGELYEKAGKKLEAEEQFDIVRTIRAQ
jgi:tetratricopeptide (TPR) repeat protein